MVTAQNEMVAAITDCRNKRIDGTLKTYVASAQCANPRIVQAFSKANYRYMDLIAAFNAQRLLSNFVIHAMWKRDFVMHRECAWPALSTKRCGISL